MLTWWLLTTDEPHLHQDGLTLLAELVTEDAHLGGVIKQTDDEVTLVTDQFPLGNTGRVQHQDPPGITVHAAAHPEVVEAVLAGGMGAAGAAGARTDAGEGRVAVAVGTEHERFPLRPRCEVNQLEVVQRTLELLVELEAAILLRNIVCLVTGGAEQSLGFGLHQLHEPPALPTAREGPPTVGQGGEGDLKELVHPCDVGHKIQKLQFEHLQCVTQN